MKRRGVTIILIITLCVIFFYGYRYLKIPVETKTAKMTQIENVITAEAYVARQEVVYSAENTGTMYSYVTEGARVAKNMCIATVYRGEVNDDLIQELNNIDIKIEELERQREQNKLFTTDSSSAESTIENIKNNIISAAVENDVSKIADYKITINSLYNKDVDTSADTITKLDLRKQEIESQLGNEKSDVYSTISGVFSKNVDGFENILTPDAIFEYTLEDFNALSVPDSKIHKTNTVNSGEEICKVVDNHVWYVITSVPKEKAQEISGNKKLLIRFDSLPGVEVSASVEYISTEVEESENVVAVLKSERYLEGVYGIRSGQMDIVVNRYTGFEVPVYALRVHDDKKGVLIASGSSEIFCECDIVYTDNEKETAIVYPSEKAKRELSTGDKIILGEKTD